ncbi:tripartite tricarboxylate transporter substrate-binding protein [Polaromonas sp.]|uniref:Bug family tripartite tricarboxylate transporter substrate binding protein n=1 Tax=Polaromonas sp. TaxID=1869339 RepID=UPI003267989A
MKFQKKNTHVFWWLLACTVAAWPLGLKAGVLDAPECLVPAKANGGFDLTCKLAGALLDTGRPGRQPTSISYLPGGIGAVAYDRMVTNRLSNPGALVAFSSGSLLNLAQGKFGPHTESDVRWVAALGADYGAIAVRADSPIRSLGDLVAQLRQDGSKVVFGAGGTVGSQDWVKAALIVKKSGRDHKSMRFVSFEGGGEALSALQGKHVTVFCGDIAEAMQSIQAGAPVRILAVLSDKRLPGAASTIPTAREQGLDVVWQTVRGVYVGKHVSNTDYRAWVDSFKAGMATPWFNAVRSRHGLYPFELTGTELDDFVKKSIGEYKVLVQELGVGTKRP